MNDPVQEGVDAYVKKVARMLVVAQRLVDESHRGEMSLPQILEVSSVEYFEDERPHGLAKARCRDLIDDTVREYHRLRAQRSL